MKRLQHITIRIIFFVAVCFILYGVKRESFVLLISVYTVAFAAFLYLIKSGSKLKTELRFSFLVRFLILLAVPALSNDFYRFIWDGRMSLLGFNPYMVLPRDILGTDLMYQLGPDSAELYAGQGSLSPGNYTCYPPLNQLFFILPAWLFPENILLNVVIMRLLIIAADMGTVFYGRKVLKLMGMPEKNILLYALNPFIIIELTGNLHFEGVMIFFIIASFYYLLRNKWLQSALLLALSISIKLIPLLFLPLFLKKPGQRNWVFYCLVVGIGSLILFLPFLSVGLIDNFMSSIDLYFRKFEFNASIYYVVRWIGYQAYGWNIIQKAGPLLGLFVFIYVLHRSIVAQNQFTSILVIGMLFSVTIYYLFATTVHPWYISVPLVLSVFTTYRFPVIWSFVVMLSYSAYSTPDFTENSWLIIVEYGTLFGFITYELIRNKIGQVKGIGLNQ